MTTPQQPPQVEILSAGQVTPAVPLAFLGAATGPAQQPVAPAAQQPTEQVAAVASAALQAEAAAPAAGDPFPVVAITYDGQNYTVPASAEDWPVSVLIAIDDQKMTHAVRHLLGPKQWIRFLGTSPRMKAIGGVFEAAARAAGFDSAGE